MTDDEINAFWLLRGEIHGGDLLAQLRDFAREVERAAREATIDECAEVCRKRGDDLIGNTGLGQAVRQTAYELEEAIRALWEGS